MLLAFKRESDVFLRARQVLFAIGKSVPSKRVV